MSKLIAGAQLFTVKASCQTIEDVAVTLDRVAKIGYTAVQVSGFGPVDMAEVGRLARENGLTVAATHMGWPRFLNELDAVIEEHKALGCVHPAIGGLPPKYRSADGLDRFIGELEPVAEKLAAAGMDFSYHNHNHEFVRIGGNTWLGLLYEKARPDVLKAELDLYWVQAGGGCPVEWVRRCAGREPLCHFKDMAVTLEREQRFAPIGEGNLNWPAIIEACRASGVEYALVEQDKCYDRDPFEELATSYRNLKAMGVS